MEAINRPTLTRDQIKNKMIEMIKAETGLTLDQAIKAVKIRNEYGTTNGESKFSTFSLVYIGNTNFAQGVKNGYGAGWYFKACFLVGCGTEHIKIRNEVIK